MGAEPTDCSGRSAAALCASHLFLGSRAAIPPMAAMVIPATRQRLLSPTLDCRAACGRRAVWCFTSRCWQVCGRKRISRIEGITRKDGRSGPLAFCACAARHPANGRALALTEWQDLVYRPDGTDQSPPPAARTDEAIAEPFAPDTTLLFRYSALTFNGHRIHYDEAYARDVEGL